MIGKASEIKTKTIYEFDRQIHIEINEFLESVPSAVVVDIKFNTYVKNDDDGCDSVYSIALVIYKEPTT